MNVIIFTILAIMAVMLIISAVLILSVGGATFIIIFGDVIVCVAIIIGILKRLFKRKKK